MFPVETLGERVHFSKFSSFCSLLKSPVCSPFDFQSQQEAAQSLTLLPPFPTFFSPSLRYNWEIKIVYICSIQCDVLVHVYILKWLQQSSRLTYLSTHIVNTVCACACACACARVCLLRIFKECCNKSHLRYLFLREVSEALNSNQSCVGEEKKKLTLKIILQVIFMQKVHRAHFEKCRETHSTFSTFKDPYDYLHDLRALFSSPEYSKIKPPSHIQPISDLNPFATLISLYQEFNTFHRFKGLWQGNLLQVVILPTSRLKTANTVWSVLTSRETPGSEDTEHTKVFPRASVGAPWITYL